ncbi:MAG TPA: citryl-CoA lyase [Kofleriaceae bacterium]|nr:citryl-CoA lyase [Kofleriaceae bacterium]
MKSSPPGPVTTAIATSTADDIIVRGRSLCGELIGRLSFTEMMWFQVLGVAPSAAQTAVIDACMVALMEHGLTPSALAARLVYSSATEAMQGGVAAGLLAVGNRFVGTTEGCAVLLARVAAAADPAAEAARVVGEHRAARAPVPGFGHDLHAPDDPRTPRLFQIARERGVAGRHIAAIELVSAALDRAIGKHVTVNATGAVAAALADCGAPPAIMRGFALVARCAGLVGHIHEEQQRPAMPSIWAAAERAVPYDGTKGGQKP